MQCSACAGHVASKSIPFASVFMCSGEFHCEGAAVRVKTRQKKHQTYLRFLRVWGLKGFPCQAYLPRKQKAVKRKEIKQKADVVASKKKPC